MIKTIILTVAIFFTYANCFSQKWGNGYVVLLNGDTLYGFILQEWNIYGPNAKPIKFKTSGNSEFSIYSPFSIRSFSIASELYRSVTISRSVMPFYFKLPETEIKNVRIQAENSDVYDRTAGAYRVGSVTKIPDTITSHGTAVVNLPKECELYKSDMGFVHVLLQTSFLPVYEIYDNRPIYFWGNEPKPGLSDTAFELKLFHVEVNNVIWNVNRYREELTGLCNSDSNIPQNDRENILSLISVASYDWQDINKIIEELSRAKGGIVTYAYKNKH